MFDKKSRLNALQVVSPCQSDWDQMSGNNQRRFCSECNKHVFDFAEMTRHQVEAVVSAHQGNLCARLTRLPDGSLLMRETPPLVKVSQRRASPILNATIAALLGISVPAATLADLPYTIATDQETGKTKTPKPVGKGDAAINGTVLDPQGNPIKDAQVKLIALTGEEMKTKSSRDGEFLFAQIPAGGYLLLIRAQRFMTYLNTDLIADAGRELTIEATLQANQRIAIAGGIGVPAPTLLGLYDQSALIAVAQVGPSVVIEQEDSIKHLRTTLLLSTIFKGQSSQRAIPFYHSMDQESPPLFKQGDHLLVFLSLRESEEGKPLDGYEASAWGDAIRTLDNTNFPFYRQLLEELSRMRQQGTPDPTAMLDWLIRLTENSETRGDGVRAMMEILRWQRQQKYIASQKETEPTTADKAASEPEKESLIEPKDTATLEAEKVAQVEEDARRKEMAALAAALTPEYKTRLADFLFKIPTLTEDDFGLVNLVQQLKDERLTPYLLTQLRKMTNEPSLLTASLIESLAENLNDPDLGSLADDYRDAARRELYGINFAYSLEPQQAATPGLNTIKRSLALKNFLTLVEAKLHR